MKTFAVVENDVIANTLIAKDGDTAERVVGSSVIEVDPRVGIGFRLDIESGQYRPTPPFQSWVFDEEGYEWVAPSEKPADGDYYWDEPSLSWIPEIERPEALAIDASPVEPAPAE